MMIQELEMILLRNDLMGIKWQAGIFGYVP